MAKVEALKPGEGQQGSPSASDSTLKSVGIDKVAETSSQKPDCWPETREELMRLIEGQAKFLDQQKERLQRANSAMGKQY